MMFGVRKMKINLFILLLCFDFFDLVDTDNMHGNLLDAMSEAIENSAVFLLCLTEKYKDSPSCRLGMIIRNRTVFSQAKLIYRENS